MTNDVPSKSFYEAASYLSSSKKAARASSVVKLELYGLFKCLTVSKTPDGTRPSVFDLSGRAKWDSWRTTGEKYEDLTKAESRYIQIARDWGWVEDAVERKSSNTQETKKTNEDSIWDSDDDESDGSRSGGGMGHGISLPLITPDEHDSSIHGLAISNDVSGMTALLESHPDTNINELDEYGYSPLHLACDRGHVDTVRLLLRKGADRAMKDPDGLTPYELAQYANHNEIGILLTSSAQ